MFTGEQIRIKRKQLGLSAQELADVLQVKKDNVYKWEKGTRPTDPQEYQRLENWLSGKMENVPHETSIVDFKKTLGELAESTPILQVVLNLSYVGKKNADSMDKMAATNQRNTDIIAALVSAILPNSKLGQQLAASLASQHTDDDLPAEAFLSQHLKGTPDQPGKVSDKEAAKNK
jgi:transcriptional regulator with XRE-family HTH domain